MSTWFAGHLHRKSAPRGSEDSACRLFLHHIPRRHQCNWPHCAYFASLGQSSPTHSELVLMGDCRHGIQWCQAQCGPQSRRSPRFRALPGIGFSKGGKSHAGSRCCPVKAFFIGDQERIPAAEGVAGGVSALNTEIKRQMRMADNGHAPARRPP